MLLLSFTFIAYSAGSAETSEHWDVLPTSVIENEAIRWTKIGAIGSCIGAGLSLFAVIISLLAYNLPLRNRLRVSMGSAFGLSDSKAIEFYTITIENQGVRAVTVDDVLISIGNNARNIVLWRSGELSIVHPDSAEIPKRLDAGESMILYLYKLRFDLTIKNFPNDGRNERLFIIIDSASRGKKYFKTKARVDDFITQA